MLHATSRPLLAVVMLLFVLLSAGCSSAGSPLPPTPTIQLAEARQTFDSGGALTFDEIMGVREDIVGDPPQPSNNIDLYYKALDDYDTRKNQFIEQLKDCKLKESIGWIGWWTPMYDEHAGHIITDTNEVVVYMDNPFSGSAKNIGDSSDMDNSLWRSIALANMTDDQVAQMQYGERIQFSGNLTTTQGLVAVQNVGYRLLDDSPPVPTATAVDLNGLQIALDRTPCFGSCADYRLTVAWDGQTGNVTFEGRSQTQVKGTVSTTIDRAKVVELVTEFKKADFFSLNDSYSANITDQPTYSVSIVTNGQSKRVQSYGAAPRRLTILMARIDQIVNTAQWIGNKGR